MRFFGDYCSFIYFHLGMGSIHFGVEGLMNLSDLILARRMITFSFCCFVIHLYCQESEGGDVCHELLLYRQFVVVL